MRKAVHCDNPQRIITSPAVSFGFVNLFSRSLFWFLGPLAASVCSRWLFSASKMFVRICD